jgi:hypothetical protein
VCGTCKDLNSGTSEEFQALPVNGFEGILHGHNHSFDFGIDDHLSAGWGFTVMAARFQADIQRTVFSLGTCPSQRVDFGMRASVFFMPSGTDGPVVQGDDRSD